MAKKRKPRQFGDIRDYWAERRQEESHAACAAMRIYGIDIDPEDVRRLSMEAAGNQSDLTIMAALGNFFRAANRPHKQEPTR